MSTSERLGARWAVVPAMMIGVLVALGSGCSDSGSSSGSGPGAGGSGGGGGALPVTSVTTSSGSPTTSTSTGASTCASSADCAANAAGKVCDVETGACVACTPAEDTCATGSYCTAENTCAAGCGSDDDCLAPTTCKVGTHECVGCTGNDQCQPGTVCESGSCKGGCAGDAPCPGTESCCADPDGKPVCVDTANDRLHCNGCGLVCAIGPKSTNTCNAGACDFNCSPGFLDCDQDPVTGCEVNELDQGGCACVPGETRDCYTGDPATLGVGVCKGGKETCNDDGLGFGSCEGQVIPQAELCNDGKDDDCDGQGEPQPCITCTPNTGSCTANVGKSCADDGLSMITEFCDPAQGLTCNATTGRCEGACARANLGTSNVGCDYWPTVTANSVDSDFSFTVAVVNPSAAQAKVTVVRGASNVASVTVAPGAVQLVALPWVSSLMGPPSNPVNDAVTPMPASVRVADGAFHLRSTQPVIVYQFSPLQYVLNKGNVALERFSYSNDASLLLPVTAWTGKYRASSYQTSTAVNAAVGFYAVTAQEDNTKVTVAPGAKGGTYKTGISGINASGAGTVTLKKGEVIEVVTAATGDVTGASIVASKPVQVIAGHQCATIPSGVPACDHLEESMFPEEATGNVYLVTAPIIPTTGVAKVQVVRIVSLQASTKLAYDPPIPGTPTGISKAGAFIEIANNDKAFRITGDKPIIVMQYMTGENAPEGCDCPNALPGAGCNNPKSCTGDPSMALAAVPDQFRDSYVFHAPVNYENSYVNVIAPLDAAITLDGVQLLSLTPIGNSGFGYLDEALPTTGNGNHTITGDKPFGINVYGYGDYTSYWYPGGSDVKKLHE